MIYTKFPENMLCINFLFILKIGRLITSTILNLRFRRSFTKDNKCCFFWVASSIPFNRSLGKSLSWHPLQRIVSRMMNVIFFRRFVNELKQSSICTSFDSVQSNISTLVFKKSHELNKASS
jgi:hypothetical protein